MMVPRLPGLRMPSSAILIFWRVKWVGFGSEKAAQTLGGVVKLLSFFMSETLIFVASTPPIWAVSSEKQYFISNPF